MKITSLANTGRPVTAGEYFKLSGKFFFCGLSRTEDERYTSYIIENPRAEWIDLAACIHQMIFSPVQFARTFIKRFKSRALNIKK